MALLETLEDIKVWIVVAIVLALLIGFDSPDASTIMMVALIAQMAVALDGIQFSRSDFPTRSRSSSTSSAASASAPDSHS